MRVEEDEHLAGGSFGSSKSGADEAGLRRQNVKVNIVVSETVL